MQTILLLALVMFPVDVGQSAWYVATPTSNCSGVVLQNGRLLTAYHCLVNPDIPIHVMPKKGPLSDENKATASKMDKAQDLLLLRGIHIRGPKLAFSEVQLGQEVYSVNYGADMRLYVVGRVARIEDKHIYVDLTCVRGCSGGGLFDADGNLVGLIHGFITDNYNVLCIASNATSIKEFLD